MATPVIMPRQGQSVESCIISKWHKKVGDMVTEGDTLFSYETDKASFDEVAKVSGKMLAIFYEEGDDVECLLNVCVIGSDGESTSEFAPEGASAAPAPVATVPTATPALTTPSNPATPVDAGNATPVIMPRQGQSVESCIISKWHKKVGDMVAEGDTLFSYETDKASFDEVAKVSGKMLAIFFEEGDDVECLLNVCVIGEDGANADAFNPNASVAPVAEVAPAVATTTVVAAPAVVVSTAKAGDALKISPRAKNLAEKTFADISLATPTGPNGRIIERDVERLISEGKVVTPAASEALGKGIVGTGVGGRVTTADIAVANAAPVASASDVAVANAAQVADYEDVPMTNIRKVIAKSMSASLTEMAQLTLNTSFDATAILNYRKVLKNKGEAFGMEKVTLNDMILYAVSRIVLKHRDINAHLIDNKMRLFNNVHLGVACDTARGLMVPTVFNANKMSLKEISAESKRVTGMCRDGACSPDLLKGASFTITNLGSLGIESFTPVINPPQTAILGVCGTETKIREKNGEISTYQAMGLSLTFDHRAVDGAPAAKFLKELCEALENFDLLLGV